MDPYRSQANQAGFEIYLRTFHKMEPFTQWSLMEMQQKAEIYGCGGRFSGAVVVNRFQKKDYIYCFDISFRSVWPAVLGELKEDEELSDLIVKTIDRRGLVFSVKKLEPFVKTILSANGYEVIKID